MKRYITKYTENGKLYAEAWDQINIFGKAYTFHRRRIEIPVKHGHGRWMYIGDETIEDGGCCSVCNQQQPAFWRLKAWRYAETPYCPHCGAKMDEVSE